MWKIARDRPVTRISWNFGLDFGGHCTVGPVFWMSMPRHRRGHLGGLLLEYAQWTRSVLPVSRRPPNTKVHYLMALLG